MSVQTEINRLDAAKDAIAAAIAGKGVTVPDGTKLDGLATLINNIQASGEVSQIATGEFTPTSSWASDSITISGIGFKPKYVFIMLASGASSGNTPYSGYNTYLAHIYDGENRAIYWYNKSVYLQTPSYADGYAIYTHADGFITGQIGTSSNYRVFTKPYKYIALA